jgi:hypothetical protein
MQDKHLLLTQKFQINWVRTKILNSLETQIKTYYNLSGGNEGFKFGNLVDCMKPHKEAASFCATRSLHFRLMNLILSQHSIFGNRALY